MANQKVDSQIDWEVIIVDNNSTDNTASVALEEWKKWNSPISIRVVSEPEPGLSHARKKGIHQSTGQFIIFCDDDNWLDSSYVQKAFEILNSNHNIGILGGIGYPKTDGEPPVWFEKYQSYFATGPQAQQDGPVDKSRNWVYGAGMIMRRDAYFRAIANFPIEICVDRKGASLLSGGDTEICYKIKLSGYEIHYSSSLKFQHYLPANRLNPEYLQKLAKSIAYSAAISYPYRSIARGFYHDFMHGSTIKTKSYLIWHQIVGQFHHLKNLRNHSNLAYMMPYIWEHGYHRGFLLNHREIKSNFNRVSELSKAAEFDALKK